MVFPLTLLLPKTSLSIDVLLLATSEPDPLVLLEVVVSTTFSTTITLSSYISTLSSMYCIEVHPVSRAGVNETVPR